jgi:hypothetical protein
MSLVFRAAKGSPLTSAEGDANIQYLSDRAEAAGFDVRRFVSGSGTTVTDAAIVSAIAAMPAAGGKLILPAGLAYALNNPIMVNKPIEIEGQGKASMYRTQKPTNLVVNHSGAAFTMQHSASLFHKFHLEYAGTQTSSTGATSKGIVVDIQEPAIYYNYGGFNQPTWPGSYGIDRVSTANFGTGIHQINGAEGQITFCDYHTFYRYGLILECRLLHDLGDMSVVGNNFYSERYNSIAGILQTGGGGLKITSCKWNQRAGNLMQYGYYGQLDGATSILQIVNNSLENIGETSIKIVPGSAKFEMVNIANNEFANYFFNGFPMAQHYVDLQGVKGSNVTGNIFRKANSAGYAIQLDAACTDYSIVPNTYFEYSDINSAVSVAAGATASVQYGATTVVPLDNRPYADQVVAAGPVYYNRLNSAGMSQPATIGGIAATIVNGIPQSLGFFQGGATPSTGVRLNGNGYVTLPIGALLDTHTQAQVEILVDLAADCPAAFLFRYGDDMAQGNFRYYIDPSIPRQGFFALNGDGGGTQGESQFETPILAPGRYHLLVNFTQTHLTYEVRNGLNQQIDIRVQKPNTAGFGNQNLYIGGTLAGLGMKGVVQDVAIYAGTKGESAGLLSVGGAQSHYAKVY